MEDVRFESSDFKPWKYGHALSGIAYSAKNTPYGCSTEDIIFNTEAAGGHGQIKIRAQVTADKAILKMMTGD